MVRITVVTQDKNEVTLQVDGWIAGKEMEILASTGDFHRRGGRRLVLLLDGVRSIDPNGLGLFGYDNTPGKDDGNTRLYDKLGGLNAQTQQDGYPGYGGVFLESI